MLKNIVHSLVECGRIKKCKVENISESAQKTFAEFVEKYKMQRNIAKIVAKVLSKC